jgi:hypothetical protein
MPTVALNLVLTETRVYSGEYLNATVSGNYELGHDALSPN